MMQIAKNVTDPFDGFLRNEQFLILDRDTKYCEAFRYLLRIAGTEPVRLPPRSPNMNAYMERFVKSIKEECTDQLILFSERSLHRVVSEYLEFYNRERFHQGVDNELLTPRQLRCSGRVIRQERLGGLLNYYERHAA